VEQAEIEAMPDDMLRLIFTCCHPALPADAQSALCLREVCGLTTEAIAAAFLAKPSTIAQRIVRAKAKIREERIAYEVPEDDELLARLDHANRVIYLMFSEGYSASSGDELIRADLCAEAIRLARLLYGHLPHSDVAGLLGLMLLQTSRLGARVDASGAALPLDEQDTRLWDIPSVMEGAEFVAVALQKSPYSTYTLQAAVAAIHAQRTSAGTTDWIGIVRWYDLLRIADPGPIVELNRIIAIGMRDGAAIGLRELDARDWGDLPPTYRYLTLTRADFLRRLGRTTEAHAMYRTALEASLSDAESRFVRRRLKQMKLVQ
jgi:RNA polymerase sigma-70 factor (ECF subfamily)